MHNYEDNYIVLQTILGSCLSDIKKLRPLQYYSILLPEEKGDCSISFILNLKIDELKQILESCGLITFKDNNIRFVVDISGHGDNYSWSIFRLENSLLVSYFANMSIARFNKQQRNVYFIGLGYDRETKINPLSQFQFKISRKCSELKRLLNDKGYKMTSILRVKTLLMNTNVEEK